MSDSKLEIAEERACGMLEIMAEQERLPDWPDGIDWAWGDRADVRSALGQNDPAG